MRMTTVFGNIVLTLVSVAGAVVFALPVIRDMNDGQVTALTGAGPASAAMVYVLLVPMLASLSQRLPARVLAVGVSAVAALMTQYWVGLVEGGQVEAAVLVLAGMGIATACGLAGVRFVVAQRLRRVHELAQAHSVIVADVARQIRHRYDGVQGARGVEGPLQQSGLVEKLVFGLLSEASTADEAEAYAEVLLHGLEDMAAGLAGNTRTDPHGYGAMAAGEYLSRLRADLRRRMPGVALAPRAVSPMREPHRAA